MNLKYNAVLYRSLRCIYLESVCACVTVEMKQFPPSFSQIFVAVLKTDTGRSPLNRSCAVIHGTLRAAQYSRGTPSGVYVCSYWRTFWRTAVLTLLCSVYWPIGCTEPRVRGMIPGWGNRHSLLQPWNRLWGSHTLLYNGYGRLFPHVESGRGFKLTTQFHLVNLFVNGAVPLFPSTWTFKHKWDCTFTSLYTVSPYLVGNQSARI